jgi:hypothetical protein
VQASNLGAGAQEMLDAFHDTILTINPEYPLPGGLYFGAGEIPWDGPGLYVYAGMGYTGQPGQPQNTNIVSVHAMVRCQSFYVQLIREVSSFGYQRGDWIDIPPDTDLNAQGLQAINDAGMLVAAATKIKFNDQLVATAAGFVVGEVMPIGPDGGLAAMRLLIDLSIDAK